MITIKGECNSADVYASIVDDITKEQIKRICDQPAFADSKIKIMADCHAGAGCVIGTTMTIKDKVVPNIVGVDIGCGTLVVKLKNKHIELQQVDKFITQNVIAGMKCRSENHAYTDCIDLSKLKCAKQCNIEKGYRSIGTLGGGNHFIEFDKDDEGAIYLVVHTGSRHLGLEVAQHYTRLAQNNIQSKPKIFIQKEIERLKSENREHEISARIAELNAQFDKSKSNKEFAYVERDDFENYLHDMKIMQQFADINRKAIASDILKGLKLKVDEEFTTVHNYIDTENMIVRKGDYIIRGVHGEYYPCKPDIFEETYEEAVDLNDERMNVRVEPEKPFFKTYSEEPTLENTEDGDMVWYKDELYIRSGDMILIPQKLNRI